MISGYKMSTAALDRIERLLLEARKGGGLDYVGSVVTGFSARNTRDLRKKIDSRLRPR